MTRSWREAPATLWRGSGPPGGGGRTGVRGSPSRTANNDEVPGSGPGLWSWTARSTGTTCCLLAPWLALPDPASTADETGAQSRRGDPPKPREDRERFASSTGTDPARGADSRRVVRPVVETLRLESSDGGPPGAQTWLDDFSRCLHEGSDRARQRIGTLESLAGGAPSWPRWTSPSSSTGERNLFSIGFNVTDRRRDTSFYDLLASEARLASYVAIAQGQVPQDHWFCARPPARRVARASPILVSWSGSMFEYLMPLLVMPNYENTLLEHTCQGGGGAADRIRTVCAACRGASRSRATTSPTLN